MTFKPVYLGVVLTAAAALFAERPAAAAQNYQIWVSNEKSGDVTIIDGNSRQAIGTLPVGKRPRGIHTGPDGHTVYVALSGTPIAVPSLGPSAKNWLTMRSPPAVGWFCTMMPGLPGICAGMWRATMRASKS